MIEVITPAAFQRFFLQLAEMSEAGPLDLATLEPLGSRPTGFVDPTWVTDLMKRHNLNSPFG